jgi:hypothetical protein
MFKLTLSKETTEFINGPGRSSPRGTDFRALCFSFRVRSLTAQMRPGPVGHQSGQHVLVSRTRDSALTCAKLHNVDFLLFTQQRQSIQGNLLGLCECHTLHGTGTVKTNNHFVLSTEVREDVRKLRLKDKHAGLKGEGGSGSEVLAAYMGKYSQCQKLLGPVRGSAGKHAFYSSHREGSREPFSKVFF